jgi:DNA-binding IclR family transcriptional regulator
VPERIPEWEIAWAMDVVDGGHVRRGEPAGRPPAPRTAVGVLDRSVVILEAVAGGARGLPAIGEATGLSKSTVHRLVTSLERHGFLFFVGGFGYALGPRLLGLATTAMRELPLRDLARPALEQLAAVTGESAQLYVRDGAHRICVDAVGSDQELRAIVEIGASLPLDRGSAGKVFLAFGSPEGVTIDDRLAQQLLTTRRRGWASSHGEREPGVASVSAPVFGPAGHLLGVVSLSGPATRILPARAKDHAPAVLHAAATIQDAIGPAR